MGVVRAGVTETINAFTDMPPSVDDLPLLASRLDDVRQANVDHHVDLIAAAARSGVRVLCLGELFASPYFALTELEMWRELAEDALTGPTVSTMREAAAAHDIVIIAPIYELDAETARRFNTAVIIESDGRVLGKYRKTHIPQGSNEQGAFCEKFYYDPSDGRLGTAAESAPNPYFPVFATSAGRIGIATCYDRHFEGVIAALAAGGAEIVFSPAVTFGAQSERLWEHEFQVDAARHSVFIGGSNRKGREAPWNQEFFGRSYFCGPDGRLENISASDCLVIADLDLARLGQPGDSGWDLRRDARPEIY